MEKKSISGTDWSAEEIDLTVSEYFKYLNPEAGTAPRPKLHIYKEISEITGRSYKAVELKFQNISAVLDRLGMEWIEGLAPRHNFQRALVAAVEAQLDTSFGIEHAALPNLSFQHSPQSPLQRTDLRPIEFVACPPTDSKTLPAPDYVEKLVRKFDPSLRDFRNRQLGRAGEEHVYKYEIERLRAAGRGDLASKVDWIADTKGDGAGYDILSFNEDGNERFIEVKTTIGSKTTPFFMTRNELDFSKHVGPQYQLVRLFNFKRRPKAFCLEHPLEDTAVLTPDSYKVSFR